MKLKHWIIFLLGLSLAACSAPASNKPTISILAAASLTESFTQLGAVYQKQNPEVELVFNFAGSQALTNQIRQGAPADIFASANLQYMFTLENEGFVNPNTAKIFAGNQLVMIVPKNNPAKIQHIQDLAKPGIQLVIGAEAVPVGFYTRQFLDQANSLLGENFQQRVLSNVVSYENNVKSVLTKVRLGEADAGVVYRSDVINAGDEVLVFDIPPEINIVAEYPIAVLKDSKNSRAAQSFFDFVLSEEGQTILMAYGFSPLSDRSLSTQQN
ncbi:MAG: molybdate ABC transporter substrate-binding protein [Anaerolineaceae bacterium]|nr:molybdate ABC transporter substrate-binding protein [Anaerolineaceae bacterium]